jgi:hypothetical protein
MLREHDRHVLIYGTLILSGLLFTWSEQFTAVRAALLIYIGATIVVSVAGPAWQAVYPSRVSFGDKLLQFMKEQGMEVSPEAAELVRRMPTPPLVETPTLLGTAIRLGRRLRNWRDRSQAA